MPTRHEERGGTDAKEVAPLHERGPHTAIEPSLSLSARGLFKDVNAIHFEGAPIGLGAAGPIDFDAVSYTHLDVYKRQGW